MRQFAVAARIDNPQVRIDKNCWSIVATEDRTVHPDLERFAAKRMGATTVELKSSHVPMLSHPREVLDVIRNAAATVAAK